MGIRYLPTVPAPAPAGNIHTIGLKQLGKRIIADVGFKYVG